MGAKIKKIEYFLPEKIITNNDLESYNENWDLSKFDKKVGIKERHVVNDNETALDLAFEAAQKVLTNYNKNKIDYLILCTQSPDYFLPTSACILQHRLGLSQNIGAHDINLGCSGFIYGLASAKGLISANIAKNVLLITAETYSKHIYPKDKTNRAIFGDGAAATIIEYTDNDSIGSFVLGTDGSNYDKLILTNGGSRNKIEKEPIEISYGTDNIYTENNLYMDGPAIYNFSIKTVPEMVNKLLLKEKIKIEDIDYFIYHQANKHMLNYIRRKQKIESDKFHFDIEKTGNTVSSTIPIALKNAITNNSVKQGDKVLLAGFGVGLSWGTTIITI